MYFTIVALHAGCGVIAILAGFASLLARKGAILHRRAGTLFAVSMTATGFSAAYLGLVSDDMNDLVGGLMTSYLVATAWTAARRKDGQAGMLELAAFCFASVGAVASIAVAWETRRRGLSDVGSGPAFVFAGVVAYAAMLDLRVVLRGGLPRRQRIARHLWRMGLAMFVASGSFFLGQMDIFPPALRRIELLSLPVIAGCVLTIFWLGHVRLARRWIDSGRPIPSGADQRLAETVP